MRMTEEKRVYLEKICDKWCEDDCSLEEREELECEIIWETAFYSSRDDAIDYWQSLYENHGLEAISKAVFNLRTEIEIAKNEEI